MTLDGTHPLSLNHITLVRDTMQCPISVQIINSACIGATAYPYPSLMPNDSCFSRCHQVPVSPPSEKSYYTESYARALLRLGNGTPLWDPIGNLRRPKAHLKSSLMIGDVGFFDIRGDFCYCFNIFLPMTDPGQGYHVPPNFEHLSPPLQRSEVVTKPKHFPQGTTLLSPGVSVSCASSEPLYFSFSNCI